MKKIIFCFLLLSCTLTFSQENSEYTPPDYDKIESNIKNKNSDLYYPKLLKRFNEADSTMTIEQTRHLYYGYVFNEKYNPYRGDSENGKALNEILKKENYSEQDKKQIIKLCDQVLLEFPFNLKILDYKSYFLNEKEKEYQNCNTKINLIAKALISSGSGISKQDAIHVIEISNEYSYISLIGLQFGGKQDLIENKYDYLNLAENNYKIPGLYFNVTKLLATMK